MSALGPRQQYESVAPQYEQRVVPMFEPIARLLLDEADPRPGEAVLEVAGGTGGFARLALPRLGPGGRYVLTDVSAGMLRMAGDVLGANPVAGVDLELRQCDLAELPFSDETFDLVVAQMSPAPESEAALRGLHRVLRPGGRLAMAFWGPEYDELALIERVRRRVGVESPNRALPDAVARRTAAAGFDEVTFRTSTLMHRHGSVDDYLAYRAAFGRPDGTPDETWDRYWAALTDEVRAIAEPSGSFALSWSIVLLSARRTAAE